MTERCPFCGAEKLETCHGEYKFDPPANIPGGQIVIRNADWKQCASCGEQILGPGLETALEEQRYRRLELLHPAEIKDVRQRMGLTQTDMAKFIGVGEKTYTRWEAGRSIQNRSSDNLIRLANDHPELFVRLEAQRNPDRQRRLAEYMKSLSRREHASDAMAAHGAKLEPDLAELLQNRLRGIAMNSEEHE